MEHMENEERRTEVSQSQPAQTESVRDTVIKSIYETISVLVSAVVIVMLMFTFLFRQVGVMQSSMVPTLYEGDTLMVGAFPKKIAQGDIVIITDPYYKNPLVKRVIATGGQTIDIDFGVGKVTVDGKVLNEPYIAELTHKQYDVDFPLTVPEGCLFVLGDNRNQSQDSRHSEIGCVKEQYIMGRVIFRLSTDWNLYEKEMSLS